MTRSNEDAWVDALAQIRALCDRYHAERWGWDEIRAILDAAPMATTPEERALAVDFDTEFTIRNAGRPPQGIDRNALLAVLREHGGYDKQEAADKILALVRPVEGVVLSREEARIVLDVLRIVGWDGRLSDQSVSDEVQRLVAHLETVEKES